MKKIKSMKMFPSLIAILGVFLFMGCAQPIGNGVAPMVSSTVPVDTATDAAIGNDITATFSEAMDPLTITAVTFTVKQGTTPVTGTVSYTGTTATFNPNGDLAYDAIYTATITIGANDLTGIPLAADKVWSFTTVAIPDVTPPMVTSTVPIDSATGVAINGNIAATFSEAINPATITAVNFTVAGGSSVPGTVIYDLPNKTAIFAPTGNLAVGTTYTATIVGGINGVKDIAAIPNPLTVNKTWSFTTASAGAGPAPVRLGTAGNFAILAKTAISTVPPSAITGDIGVSPVAESFMTGFSQTKATGYSTSPQVTGFLYAADMTPPTPDTMTTAIADLETAYTDAAGRQTPDHSNLGGGTIAGQTLYPGLYIWGTSVNITTDVTISGSANDVWIFQMSGDLILSSGKKVILSGGAQAKNIFWQVAGEASLGTDCHFEGIILCQTQVTLKTRASMNGRVLAQSLVALQQATVTRPQ